MPSKAPNPKVVAIVSQKGGSGKTTLALHLATCAAHARKTTCVIDTDPQATAAAWGDWRGDFLPAVVTSPPARLGRTIDNAIRSGVELVVIDTPPHAEAAMREAIKAAHLVLVPTRPRAFDLHALEGIADFVQFAGTPAYVVFNAVPSRATRLLDDAIASAKDMGLDTCPVTFGERAAFHRSSAKGEVASEVEPEGKAASEVTAMWQWVRKKIA